MTIPKQNQRIDADQVIDIKFETPRQALTNKIIEKLKIAALTTAGLLAVGAGGKAACNFTVDAYEREEAYERAMIQPYIDQANEQAYLDQRDREIAEYQAAERIRENTQFAIQRAQQDLTRAKEATRVQSEWEYNSTNDFLPPID